MEENKVNVAETVNPETSVQAEEAQAGTPPVVCKKCGAALQEGQEFCPKCGQKVGLDSDTGSNSFNTVVSKINNAIKKASKKKLIAMLVVAALLVVGIIAAPTVFASVEDLCEQGNYKAACAKASGDEKLAVVAENAIAVLSEESIDRLKDPTSFILRDGYYNASINDSDGELGQTAVLVISAKNSYGNYVDAYWLYFYDGGTDCWEYKNTYSSIDTEDDDEFVDFAFKILISHMVTGEWGIELGKDQVKRINTMFKDDTLHKVELIDSKTIYSTVPEE